jgi:putative hydrolase of the HAD superfamily
MKARHHTVRAVVFDLGGTISVGGSPPRWREPWLRLAERVDPDRAKDVADRLLRAEDAAWVACRDHGRSYTFDRVLAAAGVRADGRAVAAYRECWRPYTRPIPGIAAALRALRERGMWLALLSNTIWPRSWHLADLADAGLADALDATVFTSDLDWAKPHPEAFRAVLGLHDDLTPAEAVYVGDRVFEDIGGAKAAGLRAVLVSATPTSTAGDPRPDATVAAATELPDLLHRWREEADQ